MESTNSNNKYNFLFVFLIENKNRSKYEKKSFSYHKKGQARHWWFAARREIFYRIIKKENQGKEIEVLDYGCGVGANFSVLQKLTKNKLSIFDTNKKLEKELVLKYNVKKMINSKKYDLIFCTDVLEHIENDKVAFVKIVNKLKKNGILLITVPAYNYLFSEKDVYLMHYRRYNKKNLKHLIESQKEKIEIKKFTYFNFFLFIPIAAIILFHKIFNIKLTEKAQAVPTSLLNYLFKKIFSFEKFLLTGTTLSLGLSLLVVVKKT
mgnify:CR=1 FL=1|tara:strand:+ start:530 stop:1321 length:792 start_codon:yes stop_codon:yes gene_type:complete